MRLIYPLLWSRPGREACREQSVNTAAALARAGVDVTLLMPREAGDPAVTANDLRAYFDVEGDFRVVQREGPRVDPSFVPSTRWLWRVFDDPELRPGSVLYSRIPALFALGRSSHLPFAIDHYRPWPDHWPWLRPFIRRTARGSRCLGFVIHSDYAAQSYLRARVAPEQVLVAHNGADPRRMGPPMDKAAARALLGLPADRSMAVYAGRINTTKGLDQLLAIAALRPEILFLLVGSEGDGPIEAAAAAMANVRIVPWQAPAALPPYLYAADVLLIPPARAPLEQYRHCVLPMKVFQYLAAGRPILAPHAPDTAELLQHGKTACLVPADDPAAAASALDQLIRDRSLAQALSDGARRLADDLSWDHRAAKIVTFLQHRLDAIRP